MVIDPDASRAWIRIGRDLALVGCGAFMLIYETVEPAVPNPYIIAAGLAALGLPPAFRFDIKQKTSNED